MSNQFESRHKIGDLVTITARVAAVQFSGSKVRYAFDLGPELSIVDSEHVEPAPESSIHFNVIDQGRGPINVASFDRGGGLPIQRHGVQMTREDGSMLTMREAIAAELEYLSNLLSGKYLGMSIEMPGEPK
jgi:hypothetical protein